MRTVNTNIRYRCTHCYRSTDDSRRLDSLRCFECGGAMYPSANVFIINVSRPDTFPLRVDAVINERAAEIGAQGKITAPSKDDLATIMRRFGYATADHCDEMAEYLTEWMKTNGA